MTADLYDVILQGDFSSWSMFLSKTDLGNAPTILSPFAHPAPTKSDMPWTTNSTNRVSFALKFACAFL